MATAVDWARFIRGHLVSLARRDSQASRQAQATWMPPAAGQFLQLVRQGPGIYTTAPQLPPAELLGLVYVVDDFGNLRRPGLAILHSLAD